jgi:hypothetical protein
LGLFEGRSAAGAEATLGNALDFWARLTVTPSLRKEGKPQHGPRRVAHRVWLRHAEEARRPCSDDAQEDWTPVERLG